MSEDIKKLKGVSPKERIEKLKALQEKNKKEIEEAQELLKQAEEESNIEDELRDIPIPQLKAVDINELFSPEEKELFKSKRFTAEKKETKQETNELEEIAEQAQIPNKADQQQAEYIQSLSQKPAGELHGRANEIYAQFKDQGYLNPVQQEELSNIDYANKQKMNDIQSGKYTEVNKNIAQEMILTEKIKNAMSNYKS